MNLNYISKEANVAILKQPPSPVGYWQFPGSMSGYTTRIPVFSKPLRFHRWTMQVLLGFKWLDVSLMENSNN